MKKVLTVDDSKAVRAIVAKYLEPYACQVIEATNGREGVEAAREHHADLVLLEIAMPVMDGRQALAELRRDPVCKATPVIMMTAESGRETVVEVARLGVSGFIVKPFQKETFDRVVGKVLGAGEEAAEAAEAAEAREPLDPKAVLVVDDSERVLEAAKTALAGAMTVLTAASGQDAVARWPEARPGVVVVDLTMPGMDGFATLAQLRALGPSAAIALALRTDTHLHERARAGGFQAIVTKPFQAQELLEQVTAAAASLSPADDPTKSFVGEEGGCSVLQLPDPHTKAFAKLVPAFPKILRALAEDGGDRLIVDIAQVAELNAQVVQALVSLVAEGTKVGIRTAICTPDPKVVESLKQIAETQKIPAAPSRDAARESLQP